MHPSIALNSHLVDNGGGGHILQGHAGAVENRVFVVGFSAGFVASNDLTEFCEDVRTLHDAGLENMMQVAHCRALLNQVTDYFCLAHQSRMNFVLVRIVGAYGRHERALLEIVWAEEWLLRWCAGNADVALGRE